MKKPDTVALRKRANYYDTMTANAREIVRLLNEWLFYAEHGLKDALNLAADLRRRHEDDEPEWRNLIEEDARRWLKTAEDRARMADDCRRQLAALEA